MKNCKWKMENGLKLIHDSNFNGGAATECHLHNFYLFAKAALTNL